MSGDDLGHGLWYVLALVLVGSALLARRWTFRGALGMIAAWIAIFGVVLVLFSYRDELGLVASRVGSELTGRPRQRLQGSALHIARASDGHYWVEGTVNGTSARFLVDSGASITALSEATAQQAGLVVDSQRVVVMQTANGPAQAKPASIGTLTVGAIHVSALPVVVSPAFGEVNVLGMNFLSTLRRWSVEGNEMVLEP